MASPRSPPLLQLLLLLLSIAVGTTTAAVMTTAAASTATISRGITSSSSILLSSAIESRTSAYRNLDAAPSVDLRDNYDTKESQYLTPADWTCLMNKNCSYQLPSVTTNTEKKIEARGVDGYDQGDTVYGPATGGEMRFSMRIFGKNRDSVDNLQAKDANKFDTTNSVVFEDEYGYTETAKETSSGKIDPKLIKGMPFSDLSRYARNYVYVVKIKLPCWVRWVYIKIFGIKLRFPRFGWGRRCCGRKTGGGSYFSNSTGCYAGTGPFYGKAQCERVCGPFYTTPPPPPNVNSDCTFGDGSTWTHGHTEANCAGTSCTCNNGTVTCSDCRNRYEIHDVHNVAANPRPGTPAAGGTQFERKVVDSMLWVSKGCLKGGVATCAGWMDGALQNHLTYGGVAHGNSRFFAWHRWSKT